MERVKASIRRCAVYTRKSSEEGLEQNFNSLHAQREACEAFIRSQAGEGWRLIKSAHDELLNGSAAACVLTRFSIEPSIAVSIARGALSPLGGTRVPASAIGSLRFPSVGLFVRTGVIFF
jgi:hypothetical protein